MKQELSAGGAVFKKEEGETLWLLGKHSGYHKWVLPKGLNENGESEMQTAIREVGEETGVIAKVVDKSLIHSEKYFYKADLGEVKKEGTNIVGRVKNYQENGGGKILVQKTVKFFLMEYVSGDIKDHSWEMEDVKWTTYEEAVELLAFEGERKALEKAYQLVEK